MKTNYKQPVSIVIVLLLLVGISPLVNAKDNTSYIIVSGVVKDKRSNKKLEYVSISIPGTNIGTITNSDGEFSLKVKDSIQAREIEFSHIGYTNYRYPISDKDTRNETFYLTANTNLLDEIVVRQKNPLLLVESAIDKIGDNYSNQSNLLTGFYRETIQKKRNYINISEAIVDIYKKPYGDRSEITSDRVQILKGRKLLSPKPKDTLIVKLQGGPNVSIYADIVKNPDIILNRNTLPYYKFKMEESVMVDEQPHYVVSFAPQVELSYPLYYGKLYINQRSLTFSQAEFNLDMSNKDKATQSILKKKPYKLQFKPEQVSFLVNYKERNGKSYLYYIRNEVKFKCDWKKRWIFSTGYTIVSETVITDAKQDNIKNIPGKLAFKQNQSLSDNVDNFYDTNFWEDYNIIEPTESLESAVDKLKKQHK